MADVDLHSDILEATPTITTSAYAAGDLIGDKIELLKAVRYATPSGVINSVTITDLSSQGADIDIILFDSDPTATTFTDNAALDVADADLVRIMGIIQVTTHVAFVDNGVSIASPLGIIIKVPSDGDSNTLDTQIFVAMVSRGTPTYAGTTDLTLRVGVLQD